MKTKNIFLGAIALVMMMVLGSCSDDNLLNPVSGDGHVVFSVNVEDEAGTRAIGDGTTANALYYVVYTQDGEFVESKTIEKVTFPYTLELSLTRSVTYDIAFFTYAKAGHSPYTVGTDGILHIDYSKMGKKSSSSPNALNQDDDCFYKLCKGFVGGSSTQENVVMKRPMALVNFGTDDFEDYVALKNSYSSSFYFSVTTTAYTQLNLLTGEVEGEETVVSTPYMRFFGYSSSDKTAGAFPVDGYDYLTAAYLLVGDNSAVRKVSMNVAGSKSATTPIQSCDVDNVPLKTNYRTNIYGSLLTSKSNWKVDIEPIYAGSVDVWMGNSEDPVKNEDGTYSIKTPAQLAGLAKV